MKLLFDQNLSFKLVARLADIFPGSEQVRAIGLDQADDQAIWEHAHRHGFALVTMDADFTDIAALRGSPPKIIWLRCGNQPTQAIEKRMREHAQAIEAFGVDQTADCLEIF